MDKHLLRFEISAQLAHISVADRNHKSALVATRLAEFISKRNSRRFHVYSSQPALHELDSKAIITVLQERFPTARIDLGSPKKDAPFPKNQYDCIVVPLLAFDTECNRLGRGGGWYDKFLATQPHALKIGVAYDEQQVARVPREPHDMPLDIVVTPTRIAYP